MGELLHANGTFAVDFDIRIPEPNYPNRNPDDATHTSQIAPSQSMATSWLLLCATERPGGKLVPKRSGCDFLGITLHDYKGFSSSLRLATLARAI